MAQEDKIKVMIAGGGTGGHLYPGIALAQEFQKRCEANILFVGTSYGIENKILPDMGYQFKKIWIRGLQRSLRLSNILFPVRLLVSLIQCMIIILSFKPNVVIGTGGYVSGPVLMMGIAFGIPTVIQEQNSFPGLVNRLLGNWVKQVHLTYEASLPYFKKQPNTFVSGNPVRGGFGRINKKSALDKFELNSDKTTLLIFGGSQGARAINQYIQHILNRLEKFTDLQILWATGPADFERLKSECQNVTKQINMYPYIEDMASAYSAADVVLCRAGASTLSEITICGLPSILIPYPFSAAGHQEFNAKTMEKEGAAKVLLEHELTEEKLLQTIADLLNNSEKRKTMSKAALKLAKPDAAIDIVDKIESLLE